MQFMLYRWAVNHGTSGGSGGGGRPRHLLTPVKIVNKKSMAAMQAASFASSHRLPPGQISGSATGHCHLQLYSS